MQDKRYDEFLKNKALCAPPCGIEANMALNKKLKQHQELLTRWALKRGRAAIFADTGLGKGWMILEWARIVHEYTRKPALVIAPLAVSRQFEREAKKIGVAVSVCNSEKDVIRGINIINYQKIHKFNPRDFVAVALDESSILKHLDGATRSLLIGSFKSTPYKLCATATPSPNDHTELGGQADFLGIMSHQEMLATFFVHDGGSTQDWRLKGHAQSEFWKWICSWAAIVKLPSDIGCSDDGYILPPIKYYEHILSASPGELKSAGLLFAMPSGELHEQRKARKSTIESRTDLAATIANETTDQVIIWCDLNSESEMLERKIKDAIEVAGKHSDEEKETRLESFINGQSRVLVTKPTVAGFGLNLQFARTVIFCGVSHSFEQFFQAIRRSWRFGVMGDVNVHLISSEMEGRVMENLKSKQKKAEQLTDETNTFVNKYVRDNIAAAKRDVLHYNPTETIKSSSWFQLNDGPKVLNQNTEADNWAMWHGDSVEIIKAIPDNKIHLTVYSPPFASLYTYSNSDRDMGNCKTHGEFYEHFQFLMPDTLRITMPGRNMCVHCMDLPTSKTRDGEIGLRDFPGELIRAAEKAGWIWHSKITIWKDPVTAMQRTKAIGLLYKQLKKDSTISRQGIPDYVLVFRKPGINPEPVVHDEDSFPLDTWRKWASPVWDDINPSDTLQYRSARENNDERHIAPLQLEVIRRCIYLWSNAGDVVFSPFAGIGSEGFVANTNGRKFLGIELKSSYYLAACKNLAAANQSDKQMGLALC